MALIYASNQEELEQAFITMGFVEGTGEDVGKWFFNSDTKRMAYFTLTYITTSAAASPIVYYDSSGQIRNLYAQMTVANPILKIEYHELYNGGICFRWQAGTSANIDSIAFVNNMTVAIFMDNNGYSTIFNTQSNSTSLGSYYDDMGGITTQLPILKFENNPVTTTTVVILSRVYNNRDGVIEGEVYYVLTPVPNSNTPYFTTVNDIKYIITFGVSNAPTGRFAFRLADES